MLPEGVSRAGARWYTMGIYGYPVCFIWHLVFAVVFLLMGHRYLALFNIGSTLLYAGATIVTRSPRYMIVTFWAVAVEIIAHAVFTSLVFGWEAGFHYYILGLIAIVFTSPPNVRWLKIAVVTACVISYTGLFFFLKYSWHQPEVHELSLQIFGAFNMVSILFILSMFIWLYSSYTQQADDALARQHRRSERLLYNMLPEPIAGRLKAGEKVIADRVVASTVVFADLVGFTKMSADMAPDELVKMLDDIFSQFDELAEKHGLEKVKTIGDAYMVAAGLLEPHPDHAAAAAGFALDMIRVIDEFEGPEGQKLGIRVGIHSGPVVAGVIGKRKYTYDIWGDTVNTASRMESHGQPGRVHVSRATHDLLIGQFEMEERGSIEVKGKGEMRTWFVNGRRESRTSAGSRER